VFINIIITIIITALYKYQSSEIISPDVHMGRKFQPTFGTARTVIPILLQFGGIIFYSKSWWATRHFFIPFSTRVTSFGTRTYAYYKF